MREAYRKKGWAFKSADNIEQCKREGWGEKMKAQQNEGCLVYGFLEVNKVTDAANVYGSPALFGSCSDSESETKYEMHWPSILDHIYLLTHGSLCCIH